MYTSLYEQANPLTESKHGHAVLNAHSVLRITSNKYLTYNVFYMDLL